MLLGLRFCQRPSATKPTALAPWEPPLIRPRGRPPLRCRPPQTTRPPGPSRRILLAPGSRHQRALRRTESARFPRHPRAPGAHRGSDLGSVGEGRSQRSPREENLTDPPVVAPSARLVHALARRGLRPALRAPFASELCARDGAPPEAAPRSSAGWGQQTRAGAGAAGGRARRQGREARRCGREAGREAAGTGPGEGGEDSR
jgi:hypothetical protein